MQSICRKPANAASPEGAAGRPRSPGRPPELPSATTTQIITFSTPSMPGTTFLRCRSTPLVSVIWDIGQPATGALQAHLHDAVDEVYELDIAAVRLRAGRMSSRALSTCSLSSVIVLTSSPRASGCLLLARNAARQSDPQTSQSPTPHSEASRCPARRRASRRSAPRRPRRAACNGRGEWDPPRPGQHPRRMAIGRAMFCHVFVRHLLTQPLREQAGGHSRYAAMHVVERLLPHSDSRATSGVQRSRDTSAPLNGAELTISALVTHRLRSVNAQILDW